MALDPLARPISRRAAVSTLTAIPVAVAVGTLSMGLAACQGTDNAPISAASAQAALPAGLDPDIIRSIGRAWIQTHPDESTAAALSQAIRAAQRSRRQWPWQPLPSISAILMAEYTAGTTVLPDGWVVAATEARCCALVALG